MKSVLISIQPKWCNLIFAGKKMVEIRRSKPKLEAPFKVYIYCTLSGSNELFKDVLHGDVAAWNRGKWGLRKGNVIGEFVCGEIAALWCDCKGGCMVNGVEVECNEEKHKACILRWLESEAIYEDG